MATITIQTVEFEADGTTHEAILGEPVAASDLRDNQMTRDIDGVSHAIYIRFGTGGFSARPIIASHHG